MPPISTRSCSLIVSSAICVGLSVPAEAQAQDTINGGGQPRSIWDVTIGAGAAVRPTYEGSDRYKVTPIPLVNVTWNDMISLGTTGLSAYWRHENLRVGVGLTYGLGRTQNNSLFSQGDDRLAGLGDIPAALGVRGFADYRLGFVDLNASITKLTANGNNGVLVNFGAAVPYKLTDATTLMANVSVTWADQSYMQTYFGVTSTQAANSGFARYDAGAGIKDVSIGIGLNHKFDQHWAVSADVRVTRLTGDAENSPIVFSKTQATFLSALEYHF